MAALTVGPARIDEVCFQILSPHVILLAGRVAVELGVGLNAHHHASENDDLQLYIAVKLFRGQVRSGEVRV